MKLHYIFLILQLLALAGQFVYYKRNKWELAELFLRCNITLFVLVMIALIMGN